MSNWKAYDEVHFSNEYILRWVREGDEYVSRITCDMMDDLQSIVRQQADRIAELEKELSWWRTNFKLPTETNEPRPNWLYAPQTKPLSETEQGDAVCQEDDGCPTEMAVLKRFWRSHQTKPLSDEEIETIYLKTLNKFEFARAIEERHGIK